LDLETRLAKPCRAMKSAIVFATFLVPASSFAPSARRSWTSKIVLKAEALDPTEEWALKAEKAYAEAEEATSKFGVTSPEARLAWEAVEEVEQMTSSIIAEIPKPLDEECDVELDEAKCRDFEQKMDRLNELANAAKSINYQIKYEVLQLQGLKLGSGTQAAVSNLNSAAYKEAKAAAEAAVVKHGADSAEAKVAWDTVFEIVSSADDDAVSMASLEDECLVSTSDKCIAYNKAMSELQAIISAK